MPDAVHGFSIINTMVWIRVECRAFIDSVRDFTESMVAVVIFGFRVIKFRTNSLWGNLLIRATSNGSIMSVGVEPLKKFSYPVLIVFVDLRKLSFTVEKSLLTSFL